MLIIIASVLALLAVAAGAWFWNNMNYDRNTERKLQAAGFMERQFTLPDGTVLNYGEGPDNGPPLLLIHGQQSTWQTYVNALPDPQSPRTNCSTQYCPGHYWPAPNTCG